MEDEQPTINFSYSLVNWNRCVAQEGFNYNPPDEMDFNLYMMTCLSEELGEVAGVVKKLKRGFTQRDYKKFLKKKYPKLYQEGISKEMETIEEARGLWEANLRAKFKEELADLYTYLDLVLTRNKIDIRRAIATKFNEVSKDMDCPDFKIQI